MLIARRLRALGVYCEVFAHDRAAAALPAASGIILSGGPASAADQGAPPLDSKLLARQVPILGICYGMQILAQHLGGKIGSGPSEHEYGPAQVTCCEPASWLGQLRPDQQQFNAWMSHGDQVLKVPPGFQVWATTSATPIAAMADQKRALYGIQFHPEVAHTACGQQLLDHFCRQLCGYQEKWSMPAFAAEAGRQIRVQIGSERVLLALSGGVDSAVAAALIERACPGQTECVLIDNGLLRASEAKQVSTVFRAMGNRLHVLDAASEFLTALAGVSDPERKRKIIGKVFIDVFERFARNLGNLTWLGQGTIYPDVIESASAANSTASAIKSHHNVGGLPTHMNLKLLEPLRMLFKDEVRMLGKELGLPAALFNRHPFPGPGLAVRVIGEVTRARVATVRHADRIFLAELRHAKLYDAVAQAFAVLLPVATVGVMGDARSYDQVVALRAVNSNDFMTADWARLPAELLATCATRIANEVPGVSRVVYDVSSKPPATIEWE